MKPLTLNRLSVNLIAAGLVAVIGGCSSDEDNGSGPSDINTGAVGGASTEHSGAVAGGGGAPIVGTKALGGRAAAGGSTTRGATGGSNPGENTSRGGASSTTGGNLGGNGNGGTTAGAMGGRSTGGSTGSSTGGTSSRVDCGTVATDFSCVTDQDCCLVSSACHSALYLTNASQKAKVQSCLDAQGIVPCPSCLAAPVQLACVNRRCVGTVLDRNVTGYSSPFSGPHCGALPVPVGSGGASSRTTTTLAAFAPPNSSGVSAAGGAAAQAPWVPVVGGAGGSAGAVAVGGNAGVPVLATQATLFTCSSM